MSLIGFHKVLIASGILFCLGFGGWRLAAFLRDGAGGDLLVVTASALAAAGLGVYLAKLDEILDRREP